MLKIIKTAVWATILENGIKTENKKMYFFNSFI